eukprot:TRINITY_DN5812_c0_g1_i4.p2 TRINITY_DN5812_c0_g1~~TRINITY_DN5812_c0_g1_i4.p2  ORF type:complete len:166 (+),score=8.90 TRINITY_DN5812_c0_g1_i4:506-1003(+)
MCSRPDVQPVCAECGESGHPGEICPTMHLSIYYMGACMCAVLSGDLARFEPRSGPAGASNAPARPTPKAPQSSGRPAPPVQRPSLGASRPEAQTSSQTPDRADASGVSQQLHPDLLQQIVAAVISSTGIGQPGTFHQGSGSYRGHGRKKNGRGRGGHDGRFDGHP